MHLIIKKYQHYISGLKEFEGFMSVMKIVFMALVPDFESRGHGSQDSHYIQLLYR